MKLKLQQEQKEGIYWAVGLVSASGLLYVFDKIYHDRTALSLDTGLFYLSIPVALFSIFAVWLSAGHQHAWRMITLRWVSVMVVLMLYLPTTGSGFLSVNGEYLGFVFVPLLTLRYIIFFIRKK